MLIAEADNINVVLDGWTDVSRHSYVAVLFVFGGTSQYIGNLETRDERHTADVLYESLLALIKEYLPNNSDNEPDVSKLVAVVSDSAAVMKVTKRKLVAAVPNMTDVPCVLHIINLINKDVVNHISMTDLYKGACKISEHFRRSYWSTKLVEWGKSNKKSGVIHSYTETRWFSFYEMLQSISSKEQWFKTTFDMSTAVGRSNRKTLKLNVLHLIDGNLFTELKHWLNVFGCLVETTKALESDQASICDIWPQMIKMYKHFETILNGNEFPNFQSVLHDLLLNIDRRSQMYHEDVFLVAFYLNPNYRTMATSQAYTPGNILRRLAKISITFGYSREDSQSMIDEGKLYLGGLGKFNSKEAVAIKFWKNVSEPSVLKTVALRIISIIPHSAACERLFSRMNYVKSKSQNRMSADTLTALTQIKMKIKTDLKSVTKDCEVEVIEEGAQGGANDDEGEDVDFNQLSVENDIELLGLRDFEEDTDIANDRPGLHSYFDLSIDSFKPPKIPVPTIKPANVKYTVDDLLF